MYNLKEAVFDSWPSLREWRRFRIGLIPLLMFALGFLGEMVEIVVAPDLGADPDLYYRYDLAHPPLAFLSKYGLLVMLTSLLVAILGVIIDKRKAPAVIVLSAFFPALIFIGGRYW
jgi:hypothetical protein